MDQIIRQYQPHYALIGTIQPNKSLPSLGPIECSILFQRREIPSNYFQFHLESGTCDIGYLDKQLLLTNPSIGYSKVMISGNAQGQARHVINTSSIFCFEDGGGIATTDGCYLIKLKK